MRIRSVGAVLAGATLTFAAYGAVDDGRSAAAGASAAVSLPSVDAPPLAPEGTARRVDVEMQDSDFSPTTVDVKLGETVSFVFTNTGLLVHDAFIGDKAAQEQHEKEMREAKEGHDHAHEGGITVAPGQTGALRYKFDQPGTFEIGCHQPRHYEAGMIMLINVNLV